MWLPRLLRLRGDVLARRDAVNILVSRTLRPAAADLPRAVHAYAFKCDEHDFARDLLSARTNLWLYRSNQQAFCGDFVVVDVSSPDPARRPAYVLDLKRGAALRVGGGGAGVQLRRAGLALDEVARSGAVGKDCAWTAATGDRAALLAWLGA
jgi:hypothetical protein